MVMARDGDAELHSRWESSLKMHCMLAVRAGCSSLNDVPHHDLRLARDHVPP